MMDRSQEIITQQVNTLKNTRVDGETQPCRSPTSISAAVSKVLDNDDLLIEILLRLGFPTTLVCASLVCRRWLHHASDATFLCRFRELHPPCLLGFFISTMAPTPRFVPMLPQPLELAIVTRRVSTSLDTYKSKGVSTNIINCRNTKVLIQNYQLMSGSTFVVLNLTRPEKGATIIPPLPLPPTQHNSLFNHHQILTKEEEGGRMSYLYLLMQFTAERKYEAHMYMLQDGVWRMHNWTIGQIPQPWPNLRAVLADNKIYMPATGRCIVVLDLTDSSFTTIQLPQEVEYGLGKTMLSQACDVGVYLVHVKELQLSVWLHNADGWLLVDSICLLEMCASLSMLHHNASLRLKHVADNVEFVLLEMGPCVLFWDVKQRTMCKVYEMRKEDQWLGNIFPFMMIWPPTFPMLKDDPARNDEQALTMDGINVNVNGWKQSVAVKDERSERQRPCK